MTSNSKIAGFKTLVMAALATVTIIIIVDGVIAQQDLQRIVADLNAITTRAGTRAGTDAAPTAELSLRIAKRREHIQYSDAGLVCSSVLVTTVFCAVFALLNTSRVTREKEELAQRIVVAVTKILLSNPPAQGHYESGGKRGEVRPGAL
jgi:hypothetical protein